MLALQVSVSVSYHEHCNTYICLYLVCHVVCEVIVGK